MRMSTVFHYAIIGIQADIDRTNHKIKGDEGRKLKLRRRIQQLKRLQLKYERHYNKLTTLEKSHDTTIS